MGRRDMEGDDGFGETSRYAAHIDRGWSLFDRGDFTLARASGHEAHKIRPDVPDAAMLLAATALAQADHEGALEWYERAIEADTEYVEAHLAIVQLLVYDLRQPARALQHILEASELQELLPADRLDLALLEVEALLMLERHEDARDTLEQLPNFDLVERWLAPELDVAVQSQALLDLCSRGEDQALEDADDPFQARNRAMHIVTRVVRLLIDAQLTEQGLRLARLLSRKTPLEPDAWHLLGEAELRAGDPVAAIRAALQTFRLDMDEPLPEHVPDSAWLHRRVLQVLQGCKDAALRRLVSGGGLVVVVHELPSLELVLEGVDPRAPVIALAARDPDSGSSTLTGIAVYRRNIVRLAQTSERLEDELRFCVLDELANFLGLSASRRAALGLLGPESDVPAETLEPIAAPTPPPPSPASIGPIKRTRKARNPPAAQAVDVPAPANKPRKSTRRRKKGN